MNSTARRAKIAVSADGRGLVSQAGTVLLAETARVTGLERGLTDGLARWSSPPGTDAASADVGSRSGDG